MMRKLTLGEVDLDIDTNNTSATFLFKVGYHAFPLPAESVLELLTLIREYGSDIETGIRDTQDFVARTERKNRG